MALFKSNPFFSTNDKMNVDRENGIINNVVIVQEGANKNNTHFSDKYLGELATGANEYKQGIKSRFGHPNMCSTSLGSYLGRYKNFRKEGNKVFANLHLDPISKKTQVEGKGISMFEYVMDMAESNPDMFGNSIHIPIPKFEKDLVEIDGKSYSSHIYNGIVASDVVDDPAATDGLFSNVDDLGIAVTEFLDNNPSIFSTIDKDPSILEDFFERYASYQNQYKHQKFDMSFLDKLKKKLGGKETFDVEETTATGDIVTVTTENETPQVGDPVKDAEGNPVPDGDLKIKDGTVWEIEGGSIKEIKAAEGEEGDGDEEPTMAEMMASVNALTASFQKFQSQYKKDLKDTQDGISLVSDTFEDKLGKLAKTVKSSAPDYKGDPNKGKKEKFSSGYDPDKARELREAKQNS